VRENLIPSIVAKPSFPLALAVNSHYPRSTKSTRTRRLFNNSLLVLWRHCIFQNIFQLCLAEDPIKSFDDTFSRGDIDTLTPVSRYESLESGFKLVIWKMVFDPRCYSDSLSWCQFPIHCHPLPSP